MGLGKLGPAMAERLVQTGFDLRAWNSSRKEAAALGPVAGRTVGSLQELARHAEALVIVVRNDYGDRDVAELTQFWLDKIWLDKMVPVVAQR